MANGLKSGNTGLITGQQAATTAAVAIGNSIATSSFTISAPAANTIPVFLGNAGVTTLNGYALNPGESITLSLPALSSVFIIATATGATITFLGQF